MSEIIPIDTIEPFSDESQGAVVPETLTDDPIMGDGSASREGVEVDGWRIHTLRGDRMVRMGEPHGRGRRAEKERQRRDLSRKARRSLYRKARNYSRTGLALLLVAFISFVAVMAISYSLEIWGGHSVPNVVGLSRANAVAELTAAGFDCEVEEVPADEVQGHVVAIEPSPDSRAALGSTIKVLVSENRIIPEVEGMTREGATRALEKAGAKNIRYESLVLLEEENKVLEVRPAAGSTFMSSDEVTLVVGERPIVPGVFGLTEAEARDVLLRAGVPVVTNAFEPAGIEGRLLAQRTDPKSGSKSTEDGVILYMGDPLVAVQRLADYFDAATPHIHEFLEAGGLMQKVAHRNSDGHLIARYEDELGGSITFCYDPWSQEPSRDESYITEIMQEGSHIEGVRLEVKSSSYKGHMRSYMKRVEDAVLEAQSEDEEEEEEWEDEEDWDEGGSGRRRTSAHYEYTSYYDDDDSEGEVGKSTLASINSETVGQSCAEMVMGLCGFENMIDSCTQQSIKLPEGATSSGHVFYCCNGEMGDYAWTVLVRGSSDEGQKVTEIVATCLPKVAYEAVDLSPFGDRICNFVAYQDEYVG